MNPLQQIHSLGQQIWLDNLSRSLLNEGSLERMIKEDGISGITTNPSIFHKAISGGRYYEDDLTTLKAQPLSAEQRYEHLAVADVQRACDLLKGSYEESGGLEGYVSLEVSPGLAHDAAGTIAAGKRLKDAVGRDNVLIKVPATAAGLQAITGLISDGISVNVTLMFSLEHVHSVADAYIAGLQKRLRSGQRISQVFSVASLFLSRVDTLVDNRLAALGGLGDEGAPLRGRTAVAMAKLAYQLYRERFHDAAFAELRQYGAKPQYMLWASTGTKNPDYSDLLYVEPLIGTETVNTLPDATLAALLDHGRVADTLEDGVAAAQAHYAALKKAGIDMQAVGEQLQQDGLSQFETAFGDLLKLTA